MPSVSSSVPPAGTASLRLENGSVILQSVGAQGPGAHSRAPAAGSHVRDSRILGPRRPAGARDLEAPIEAMTVRIAHRGPDDSGVFVDESAASPSAPGGSPSSTSRRTGHQPMVSGDGRYVIAYNGGDLQLLRAPTRAQELGSRFRGSSDTEVLVTGVQALGAARDAPAHATACTGWRSGTASSAACNSPRDRFGEKPLYYGWCGGVFMFGSELKALARHAVVRSARSTATCWLCTSATTACRLRTRSTGA